MKFSTRKGICLFMAALISMLSGTELSQSGIFAVVRGEHLEKFPETLFAGSAIDGITIYMSLKTIAPFPGQYDWKRLDEILSLCRKYHKPVNLAIIGGRWVPEWLYERGAQKFSWRYYTEHVDAGTSDASAPVPWDDIYLTAMSAAIRELGKRYAADPLIVSIQVTGPALENGLEANLNISRKEAESIGYTPEKLIAAWQRMFQVCAEAFPRQNLSWCIHDMFPEERSPLVGRTIRTWAAKHYPDRLMLMACYLTHQSWFDRGNQAVDIWCEQRGIQLGVQLIDIYSSKAIPPEELGAALRHGRKLGASYVELFAEDLIVDDYYRIVKEAREE